MMNYRLLGGMMNAFDEARDTRVEEFGVLVPCMREALG